MDFFLDLIMQPIVKSPFDSGDAEYEFWGSKHEPENPFPVPEGWDVYPEWVVHKPKTTRATTTTTTAAPPTAPPKTAVLTT